MCIVEYRVKDFALYLLSLIFDYLLNFNKRFYSFLFKLVAQKGQKTDQEETSEPRYTFTTFHTGKQVWNTINDTK